MKQVLVVAAVVCLVAGCARVYVPPKVDLKPFERIGIIEFTCSEEGKLGLAATRAFIQKVTTDQTDIGIIELGTEADILSGTGKTRVGPDELKELAKKYGVSSVFTGNLQVSEVRPRISIGPGLAFASFQAEVEASLTCRLVETETGATRWSGSSTSRQTVGGVSKFGAAFSFDAKDPQTAYGKLVRTLVHNATADFRHSWRCR